MKRILSLGLVLTMICTLLTFMPATAASIIDSGTCGAQGDNLKWTLDSEGILTIIGTGEMKDYGNTGFAASPWGGKGYNAKIKKVIINKGVTSIGSAAFWSCVNLESITIPQGVTNIGAAAFGNCTALKEISLPDSIMFIDFGAFTLCNSIRDVYISSLESWLKINLKDSESSPVCYANNVYINGKLAKSITIPNNITEIGDYAFSDWRCLEIVNLPIGITKIGKYSFAGCTNLDNINLPDTLTSINMGAFQACIQLESINIPNKITSISENVFGNCKKLKKVNIPNKVSVIETNAFKNCESLFAINLPDSMMTIGVGAFSYCSGLKKVGIPKSVKFIKDLAFSDCVNLKDIYYLGTETEWEKIEIGDFDNDPLLNATIHYNSPMPSEATSTPKPTPKPMVTATPIPTAKPTIDPNAPSVEITEVSDYLVAAKVNNYDDFEAQVILAVYNKNGALIEMQNYSAWDEVLFFSTNLQNTNIKVMLWSDMDSAKPLAETAEMSL